MSLYIEIYLGNISYKLTQILYTTMRRLFKNELQILSSFICSFVPHLHLTIKSCLLFDTPTLNVLNSYFVCDSQVGVEFIP